MSELNSISSAGEQATGAGEVRHQISDGEDYEAVIGQLRERGCDKLQSIKALMLATGMSLREAKTRIHQSRTWRDKSESDQAFHNALARAVGSSVT